ncbi:MAG: preprotein translocase subunit YajC [Elusimicrobia bacterium]|nr:preprotein translocase subunit YajC [Elusimicrobiota bacterium]
MFKNVFSLAALAILCVGSFAAAQGAPAPQAPQGAAGLFVTMFPILVFGAIFYFLLLRPQQKANQERQKMLTAIKRNDRVLTSGGVYGTVLNIKGDILDVKLADNVKVEVNRSYIAKVITSAQNGAAAPSQDAKS